jgi:hypothetical protein
LWISGNAEPNFVPPNLHHTNFDVASDHDGFTDLARKYQHTSPLVREVLFPTAHREQSSVIVKSIHPSNLRHENKSNLCTASPWSTFAGKTANFSLKLAGVAAKLAGRHAQPAAILVTLCRKNPRADRSFRVAKFVA